ncbi:atpD [Acrasis kona]|uniref:AtpD n=1 Tax=Acrasis kona TaxID=1008807 RepID=A0AAW2ZN91_9EUKA
MNRTPHHIFRDGLNCLVRDHERFKIMFLQYRNPCASPTMKKAIVQNITSSLSIHHTIEEKHLYPLIKRNCHYGNNKIKTLEVDDKIISGLTNLLHKMNNEDELQMKSYDRTVEKLIGNINEHIQEQEEEIFPQLRDTMDEAQLEKLFNALESSKWWAPKNAYPFVPKIIQPLTGVFERAYETMGHKKTLL